MTRRPVISLADLQFIARMEGRPKAKGREVAAALGVSRTSAWRLLNRLKAKGVIRFETAVRRDLINGGCSCECVVYLKTRLSDQAMVSTFEAGLTGDVSVRSFARISGRYDYRIHAAHPDARAANNWYRTLLDGPAVNGGTLDFIRTVFDRPTNVAALLGIPLDKAGD